MKLNIKIPFEDVMKAIRKEEEARRIKPDLRTECESAPLVPSLTMNLPVVIPPKLAGGATFDYVATLDANPIIRDKESDRRLLELFENAFPGGHVPVPIGFALSPSNSSPS